MVVDMRTAVSKSYTDGINESKRMKFALGEDLTGSLDSGGAVGR